MSGPKHEWEDAQGKYRLLVELGQGGTANVHLAVARGPSGFNKLVVLKVLKKALANDPELRLMFLNEARLSARLSHRNVVQTYEVFEDHGLPVIVMEYLEGQPLSNIIIRARDGPALLLRVHLQVIVDVLSGLTHSHELTDYDGTPLNVVHRDMSPHNVFVTFDGQVKILDFGIAKLSGSMVETEHGVIKGKLRYMPPEQIVGDSVDCRADVFAIGVVLWEALTGDRMWKGMPEASIMNAVLEGRIPSPRVIKSDVSDDLERICMKALAPRRDDRYASAFDLQRELMAVLAHMGPAVTSDEIGSAVQSLFRNEREETRRLIDRELREPESPAIRHTTDEPTAPPPRGPSSQVGLASHTAVTSSKTEETSAPAIEGPRGVWGGLGIGVFALAGAAGLLAWQVVRSRASLVASLDAGVGDGGFLAAIRPPGLEGRAATSCTEELAIPYVVSDGYNALFRFDPVNLAFDKIGVIRCPTGSTVNAMAVDRSGLVWVNYLEDGKIYRVNPKTLACEPSEYVAGGTIGFSNALSMHFAASARASGKDVLYVSDHAGDATMERIAKGIARADLTTMKLAFVGPFTGVLAGARCELSGTPDGRLFGFFEGNPAVLAEIDEATGATRNVKELTGVATNGAYAFSFWGGYFWLYTTRPSPDHTMVTRYDPKSGETKVVVSAVGFSVVGAGVSPCAPSEMPPRSRTVIQIAAGDQHTCALLRDGSVRCWGDNSHGQLGYADKETVGDDEPPGAAGDVNVGGVVRQIAAGHFHTCALLETDKVRCWGSNSQGQLGYGHTRDIGDDETPASAGDVDIGGPVRQIAAGGSHTCAVLENGKVRCWGRGDGGHLGYGNKRSIGDDETPASAGDVDVGGAAVQIAAGSHTCVILKNGNVRCWGGGTDGRLGYGNAKNIGDDESPASAGDVKLGGKARQIAVGHFHTCALLETGTVRCWGSGGVGQLGYDGTENIGNDKTPAMAGDVDVGEKVSQVAAGGYETCAVLEPGKVRCWGLRSGKASASGDIDVGGTVRQIAAGGAHVCVLLETGKVRCWGDNHHGQLGIGHGKDGGSPETTTPTEDVSL